MENYTYNYPHPAVATDCVVLGFDGESLKVLLVERGVEPYKGAWALPGGFMRIDETAEQCARRELAEETGLDLSNLHQLGAFTAVHRDPRERVVSIAFYALARQRDVRGGNDAAKARWVEIDSLPPLAFDHDTILHEALLRLRRDIRFEPVGFGLLDESFTMPELQRLYEAILGRQFDRRNFNKKMLQAGVLHDAATDSAATVESHTMRRMDIGDLFASEEPHSQPGRRGRQFSFDAEAYARMKEDDDMKTEF